MDSAGLEVWCRVWGLGSQEALDFLQQISGSGFWVKSLGSRVLGEQFQQVRGFGSRVQGRQFRV